MFDLTDRTALVTGATGGIGAAIARAMHAKGAVVAISGRRGDKLDALAGQLAGRVHVFPCDIANKEEVEALIPAAQQAMGHVDILVLHAHEQLVAGDAGIVDEDIHVTHRLLGCRN